MITTLFLLFIGIATVAAARRWRTGVLLGMVVGVLQDPIRKLTPGAPPLMAVCSLPIWIAAFANLYRTERGVWSRLRQARPGVSRGMAVFLIALLPATLVVFQYGFEAWRMAVLGMLGYAAPLAAVSAGFAYAQRPHQVRRLLAFYCVLTALMLGGSLLEYLDLFPDWAALGTEALGTHWIRYTNPEQQESLDIGAIVQLVSGFYRSPDIMGWHAAALVMLALTLALQREGRKIPWLILAAWGAFGVLVAARRKMVMMPVVWTALVTIAYLKAGRTGRLLTIGLLAVLTFLAIGFAAGEFEIQRDYYVYAGTATLDAPTRLWAGTLGGIWSTFVQSGPLGRGIGSVAAGSQYLDLEAAHGWQEGGMAKIAVELGLPGVVCALLLATALARALLGELKRASTGSPEALQIGLIGLAAANAASFVVSHQAYGDLLIMTLSAFFIGIALSGPRWVAQGATPPPGMRATVPRARTQPGFGANVGPAL